MQKKKKTVPIDCKPVLTISEAAELFNIGQHVLRNLAKIPGNNFSMKVGVKTLIKKKQFLEYLDSRHEL